MAMPALMQQRPTKKEYLIKWPLARLVWMSPFLIFTFSHQTHNTKKYYLVVAFFIASYIFKLYLYIILYLDISLLNIILTYLNHDKEKRHIWCKKYNLNHKHIENTIKRSNKKYGMLLDIFKRMKIKSIEISEKELSKNDRLLLSIYSGYHTNTSNIKNNKYPIYNKYETEETKMIMADVKNTFLDNKNLPKAIIYHEIFKSINDYECNIISEISNNIIKYIQKIQKQIKIKMCNCGYRFKVLNIIEINRIKRIKVNQNEEIIR